MFGTPRVRKFPPVSSADEHGLLMVGGQLSPDWLVEAYEHGIFPWPIVDGGREILAWWSPDPRAILELDQLRVSRRLQRRLNRGEFELSIDRDFAGVIAGCAEPRKSEGGVWLTPTLMRAYLELHRHGHAHSIEVWQAGELVGGAYGVALGGFFAGESMFHRRRDASKAALYFLVQHLRGCGFRLFDIQMRTAHMMRLGATEISRERFLQRLNVARHAPVSFDLVYRGMQARE